MRVLIQLRASQAAVNAASSFSASPSLTAGIAKVPGCTVDQAFAPVPLPRPHSTSPGGLWAMNQPLTFSTDPMEATYLVRGTITRGQQAFDALMNDPNVVGVHADPVIESSVVCPGNGPVGSDADVARLLDVPGMKGKGLDGRGVRVAVVDTGINLAHLKGKGRKPKLDNGESFTPAGVPTSPGAHPPDHGTMCAYDVGIAAPSATLLDHAVLLSRTPGTTVMAGLLSDAVAAFSRLRGILLATDPAKRRMVVSNSWGMFDPSWDFPVGHPGNYSDNPAHPFNLVVASLEHEGADILFAAGNCGRDCPDGRCRFNGNKPICGANSHPLALSVAGVDTTLARVGYSSQGPGRLENRKPDIAGFTHFVGSGIYPADGGTSAACPVVAGVVAAIRTKLSAAELSPMQMRAMLWRTATDLGAHGFDFDFGFGAIDAPALRKALVP